MSYPNQMSLSKSRAWRCLWRKIVIVCQPIRTIFSYEFGMYKFHFPFQRRIWFFTQLKMVCDWFYMISVEAQRLVATFVKVLCSGTMSLYIDLWRWTATELLRLNWLTGLIRTSLKKADLLKCKMCLSTSELYKCGIHYDDCDVMDTPCCKQRRYIR